MKIILIGPQGSGKGTIAQLISEKYNIPQISTGDIFRREIALNTVLGKKLKAITAGNLAPDKLTIAIMKKRLLQEDCEQGCILDGFPRNIVQARALDDFSEIDYVFELKIDDKTAIERISARRQCKSCHRIYGLNLQPKKQGVCDNCNGKLYQREDDKPAAIKKRLQIYHEETEPLLDYYRPRNIVYEIDASQNVEGVFRQVEAVLG